MTDGESTSERDARVVANVVPGLPSLREGNGPVITSGLPEDQGRLVATRRARPQRFSSAPGERP